MNFCYFAIEKNLICKHFDFGLHREMLNLLPAGCRLFSVPHGCGLRWTRAFVRNEIYINPSRDTGFKMILYMIFFEQYKHFVDFLTKYLIQSSKIDDYIT